MDISKFWKTEYYNKWFPISLNFSKLVASGCYKFLARGSSSYALAYTSGSQHEAQPHRWTIRCCKGGILK